MSKSMRWGKIAACLDVAKINVNTVVKHSLDYADMLSRKAARIAKEDE